jgi:hypothetical protein
MHQTQGHPSIFKKKKKKTLKVLREQIDPYSVIVGDLNTPLSPIDRSSRQKIDKDDSELLHMFYTKWTW